MSSCSTIAHVVFVIVVGVSHTTEDNNQCDGEGHVRPADKYHPTVPKLILYWTTYYGHGDFDFGFGAQPFLDAKCPVSNCVATNDKAKYGSADAVIFHMRNVAHNTRYPPMRFAHQRYVFFLLEHPHHQWNDLAPFDGFFNWTMTYRLDSDVQMPYGLVVERPQAVPVPPLPTHSEISSRKPIAWFVSNCNSFTGREKYVAKLQEYIPVDVYGKCGPLKCPTSQHTYDARMDGDCYTMLEKNYNFYISFENNFCTDYVTEKMFNILKLNVVPIVFGGTQYSRDAPSYSVINVVDYPSPKQLANYIKYLTRNKDKYIEYLRWKRSHMVLTREAYTNAFCKLCEKLNNPHEPDKVHHRLNDWWGKSSKCNLNILQQLKHKGNW